MDLTVQDNQNSQINTIDDKTQDKDILKLVLSNKTESQNYLIGNSLYDEWREYNDLYRSIPDEKPEPWMSNVFVPLTQPKVEAATTNVVSMLFSEKPPVNVKPREFTAGDDLHAGIIKTILAKQMEDGDFLFNFFHFIKQICIYGLSFGKVSWDYSERIVKIKKKIFQPLISVFGLNIGQKFAGYGADSQTIVKHDRPYFEVTSMYDSFYDSFAKNIDDSWFIHRTYKTRDYLKSCMLSQSNPYGVYNDKVLDITEGDATNERFDRRQIEANVLRNDQSQVTRPKGGENIELLEWHGKYDINGDGRLENCILTVAAGKYVIRKSEEPFYYIEKPVVSGNYVSLTNEITGIGVPEQVGDCQHLINENVNQRNDNVAFVLNSEKLYRKNSGLNLAKLKSRPGQLTGVDDPSDVTYNRPPDVTQSSFMHCGEIERWMQEVTSITRQTLGVGMASGSKTATSASILETNVEDKFMMIAKIIENMSFNKIARMFWEMDYQFLDEQQISELSGIDVSRIDITKLRPDFYIFEPAGVKSVAEKNTKTLKLLQFLNIADRYAFVNKEAIVKKILSLLNISDNPEEFIYSDAKMAQLMQMAQSMGLPPFFGNGMQGQGGQNGQPPAPGNVGNEGTQFNGTQIQTPGVPPTAETNVPPNNMKN